MTIENRSPEGIAEMFAACQSWLEDQPGMKPFERGAPKLVEHLDQWLADYSAGVCEEVVTNSKQGYSKYMGRLWSCWSYHWKQATGIADNGQVDGLEVAGQIRSGRGYQRGGRLGGDPMRDVVLAVAMTCNDNRAPVCFRLDYYDFSKGLASKKLGPRFRDNIDDWWNEFLDHLAGYTRPTGKLDKFSGHCALKNWLGTTLWFFLQSWIRAGNLPAGIDDELLEQSAGQPETHSEEAEIDECFALFVRFTQQALEELSAQDRLILFLLYVEHLPLKEVARLLGVHPGNAGKRRDRVIKCLQELLKTHAVESGHEQSWADCMDSITARGMDFGTLLCSALTSCLKEEEKLS